MGRYVDYASRELVSLQKGVAQNKDITSQNREHFDNYLNFLRARGLNERTIMKNGYCFRIFLQLIDTDIDKLTRLGIEKAMAKVEGSKYSAKTKKNIKTTVKSFYKHFRGEDEFYPREVSWIKTTMKGEKHMLPEDILSEEEVSKMIGSADNPRDKAIIALLFDAGIRIGELITLRFKDIDLKSNPAHITVNGKTGMRKVPIMFSVPYLASYLSYSKDKKPDKLIWWNMGQNSDKSLSLDYDAVRMMLKRVGSLAKIEKRIYPHLFRHSRASNYANKLTEQQLKAFFGWAGDSRMVKTYVHLSGRDIDNAVLEANGEKPISTTGEKPKLAARICNRCQLPNMQTSIYCTRCGGPLDVDLAVKVVEQDEKLREAISDSLSDPAVVKMLLPVLKGILKEKAKQ